MHQFIVDLPLVLKPEGEAGKFFVLNSSNSSVEWPTRFSHQVSWRGGAGDIGDSHQYPPSGTAVTVTNISSPTERNAVTPDDYDAEAVSW